MKKAYYKYRPLYRIGANGGLEVHPFTQSMVQKAEIWYSAPADFNDPFDCNMRLHFHDSTDAEWDEHFEDLIRRFPSDRAGLEKAKSEREWKTGPEFGFKVGGEMAKDQVRTNY